MLSVCRVLLLFVCVFCLVCCDVAAANKTDVQSVVSRVREKVQQAQQLWQNATDKHKNKVMPGVNELLSLLKEANEITDKDKIAEVIGKIKKAEEKAKETTEAMETTKTLVEKIKAAVGALADVARTAAAAEKEAGDGVGGASDAGAAADTALQLWGNVTARMDLQLAAVNDTLQSITAAKDKFEEQKQREEQSSRPSPEAGAPAQALPATDSSAAPSQPGPPTTVPDRPSADGPSELAQRRQGLSGEASPREDEEEPPKAPLSPPERDVKAERSGQQAVIQPAIVSEAEELRTDGQEVAKILKPVSLAKPSLLSPVPTTTKFNVLHQTALTDAQDNEVVTNDNDTKNALQLAINNATELNNKVQETNNVMVRATEASAKAAEAAEKWTAALMSGDGKSTRGGGDAASLLSSSLFSPGSIPGVACCFAFYYFSVCAGFCFELTVF